MRVAPLLLLGLGAVACAKEPAPAITIAAAPQEVAITATDFGYVLPTAPIHAGLTTVTLVNQGAEVHHATLIRLEDGKTVADYLTALQAGGPPPTWGVPVGGPNAAPPSGEANATLVLEPGTYAVVCFIPSADGVLHLAKGMVTQLEVQPATGPVAQLPAGDNQITLADYSFAFAHPPTAGAHTFTVRNDGKEVHELVLVSLAPGMTAEQVGAWYGNGQQGPPPGTPVGGLAGMMPGQVENFSVTDPRTRHLWIDLLRPRPRWCAAFRTRDGCHLHRLVTEPSCRSSSDEPSRRCCSPSPVRRSPRPSVTSVPLPHRNS